MKTLDRLEWQILIARLAAHAQTEDGRQSCLSKTPNLHSAEIIERWRSVTELRDLIRSGYNAPIGDIKPPHRVFKSAEKGQLLEGLDFRLIIEHLFSAKKVLAFSTSFASKSSTLQLVRSKLSPLVPLSKSIETCIAVDGSILDTASSELASIRSQKTALRKKIEQTLIQIMHEPNTIEYLQDDFYTVRHDTYVIPLRLDGRGRVRGRIIDTSDSGQTLFLEPAAIAHLNIELQDLDVAEKLEIIRIFQNLSAMVAKDLDALQTNYQQLVALDVLSAEASLAFEIDAGAVEISEVPCLKLIAARHPLIRTRDNKSAEPSTIILNDRDQFGLIVSGPNAGGKTVVLKTTGLLHLMAKSGLLIPADSTSKIYIFDKIHVEMGDSQNITANLSTFSGHLQGLKPILESASANDLVLLDELATGTEPQTGAAIARSILEHLIDNKVTTIATTHYDNLKILAQDDSRYRNASMEYEEATYRPTYRLILDVPGQSYGLELAKQMGIPSKIIDRARAIKGTSHTALDDAISALQRARIDAENLRLTLNKELLAAEASKARWDLECKILEEQRGKAARQVAAKLENEIDTMRSSFEDNAKELRDAVKEIRTGSLDPKAAYEKKREVESKLRDIETSVTKMAATGTNVELPGTPVQPNDLREGLNVFVLPLKREGTIAKLGATANDAIEVQVGIIKVRVGILDLRKTRGNQNTESMRPKQQKFSPPAPQEKPVMPQFVPQNERNTLDIRGSDSMSAPEKVLNFIDRCLLAGEKQMVIIHGNGGDRLKTTIRWMLKNNCPYNLVFRPGESNEGGDGVTVIGGC